MAAPNPKIVPEIEVVAVSTNVQKKLPKSRRRRRNRKIIKVRMAYHSGIEDEAEILLGGFAMDLMFDHKIELGETITLKIKRKAGRYRLLRGVFTAREIYAGAPEYGHEYVFSRPSKAKK